MDVLKIMLTMKHLKSECEIQALDLQMSMDAAEGSVHRAEVAESALDEDLPQGMDHHVAALSIRYHLVHLHVHFDVSSISVEASLPLAGSFCLKFFTEHKLR